MVDLSTSETTMRKKKKPREYIEPDAFYTARRRAGLDVINTADLLQVNPRTIRNWENGVCKIPYAAFRLLRMSAGYSLLHADWAGWGFHNGTLFAPEGRSFKPYELRYLSTYISLAKHFLKLKQEQQATFGGANFVSNPPTSLPEFSPTLRSPPRGSHPAELGAPHPLAPKRAEKTWVESEAA